MTNKTIPLKTTVEQLIEAHEIIASLEAQVMAVKAQRNNDFAIVEKARVEVHGYNYARVSEREHYERQIANLKAEVRLAKLVSEKRCLLEAKLKALKEIQGTLKKVESQAKARLKALGPQKNDGSSA